MVGVGDYMFRVGRDGERFLFVFCWVFFPLFFSSSLVISQILCYNISCFHIMHIYITLCIYYIDSPLL